MRRAPVGPRARCQPRCDGRHRHRVGARGVGPPLGNFTVNYHSGIHVGPTTIDIDVVVDRAESPTLQAFPDAASGQRPAGADTWRVKECADLAAAAQIRVADQLQALGVTGVGSSCSQTTHIQDAGSAPGIRRAGAGGEVRQDGFLLDSVAVSVGSWSPGRRDARGTPRR